VYFTHQSCNSATERQNGDGAMTSTKRILVVDDEPDIGDFISTVALTMGLSCVVTTDATSFLGQLTPATSLILLDLVMPHVDGIELLRVLAKQDCKAGIVLMSGVGSRVLETAEQLAQALGLSVVGHLSKPFRIQKLQRMLASATASVVFPVTGSNPLQPIPNDELLSAVEHNEFEVHYQPLIEMATGNVIGVEALVRWSHPTRGPLLPDEFIGRMEEAGMIGRLDWLVAQIGMQDIGRFADRNGTDLNLSVNVSVLSLRDLTFPERLLSLVARNGMSVDNLTIEITESGLIQEPATTLDVLTRLRMRRVKLSIDDFGTGYAMMQQLRNVPATELKIDRSLVAGIHKSARDRIMIQKTIEIGHELGMKVVAEGVETQAQVDFLREKLCDSMQGYLFSCPLPSEDLLKWLGEYRSRSTPAAEAEVYDRAL